MSRFSFPYPVKPWKVNQEWGIYNPAYQRFGFTRHNGTDVALGINANIAAPFPGTIIRPSTKENGQWQPNGGGVFVSLISDEKFDFPDGLSAYVFADFLHCDHLLVQEGQHVSLGDTIAIADNTGFSTGPHTHIQLRRCAIEPGGQYVINGKQAHLAWLDQNEANNSFDPTPYYSGTYAIDTQISALQTILSLLKQLLKGR